MTGVCKCAAWCAHVRKSSLIALGEFTKVELHSSQLLRNCAVVLPCNIWIHIYAINITQKFYDVSSCLAKCQGLSNIPSVAMHSCFSKRKNRSVWQDVWQNSPLWLDVLDVIHSLVKFPCLSKLFSVTKCSGLSWSKSSTSVRCVTRFPSLANQLTVLEPSVTNLHLIAKLGQKHTILFVEGWGKPHQKYCVQRRAKNHLDRAFNHPAHSGDAQIYIFLSSQFGFLLERAPAKEGKTDCHPCNDLTISRLINFSDAEPSRGALSNYDILCNTGAASRWQ